MRAVAIACVLLTSSIPAVAQMTIGERVNTLWERAIRQTDFAKWDDAVETGRHAVEIAPESADAWALMAYAHWIHPGGLVYLARGQIQRALGLDPNSARARMVHGLIVPWLTDPPDFERSIGELERAVEINPALAQAWSRLGLTRYDAGHPEAALPDIRRAIELDPKYYEWRLHLGEVLLAVGEAEEAVASNRQALERTFSPFTKMVALNNLAWSLCLLNPDDPELQHEALTTAARLAADMPDDPEILDTLGTAELLFGDPIRAEQALRAAIESGNNSWGGLGYALALQGKSREARAALAGYSDEWLAEQTGGNDAYLAGLAWDALGEPRIARRVFDAAVRRWPDHPWADEMQEWIEEQ